MGFDISLNSFRESVAKKGLLNPSRYIFTLTAPNGSSINAGDSISMRVSSVNWPGKSIRSIDSDGGQGPVVLVPMVEAYDALPVEFMCSKSLEEHKFFSSWMDYMMGTKMQPKYYRDCVGHAQIRVLDEAGEVTSAMDLINCFPTVLGPVELAGKNVNEFATFTVDLVYHHWELIS
jgi:hypothetical protein